MDRRYVGSRILKNRAVAFCTALSALVLGVPITAGAWSSRATPISEQIHQIAIQDSLTDKLSAADLAALLKEQAHVDDDQGTTASYKHAMTGVDNPALLNATRPIYVWCTNEYIRSNLIAANAQYQHNRASNPQAMVALGDALHALEDATSPAHQGFQQWSDHFWLWTKSKHLFQESAYPSSDADKTRRGQLEATVLYAYGAMLGQPVPELFFEPKQHLLVLPGDGQPPPDPKTNLPPHQSDCRKICPSKACDTLPP